MVRRHHRPDGIPAGFEMEIEKLVYGGEGLGRHEGKVVFVPFTVPGDRVEVHSREHKKGFVRAAIAKILRPGPGRSTPPCPHFGRCGGCQWQQADYALQVETKRKILEDLFRHHFPEARKLPISMKPCPDPFGYRSRARVQLRGTGTNSKVGFFFYRGNAVEDIDICPLLRPALNDAWASVRRDHREGLYAPGDTEIELACADDGSWAWAQAGPEDGSSCPPLERLLRRKVGDFEYATAASVFFQANDFMVPVLVQTVLELAKGGAAALDLFSGVGLFSLPLARRYRKVVAVECNPQASRLCARNAADAGFENIEVVCAGMQEWSKAVSSIAAPGFDLILLDPPRTGAGPAALKRLAQWAPEAFIYVSCDPQTLCRDLAALPARDYHIDFVGGVDMFPQTYHIETVVRLCRR